MKVTRLVKFPCFSTTILSSKRTISCLTALTMCLQSGVYLSAEAKSKSKKHIQNSIKKARYNKSRNLQIAKLPFNQTDDETDSKSNKEDSSDQDKEKKSEESSKDKNGTIVIDDIDVIEIDQDNPNEKQEETKSTKKENSAKEKETKEVTEEPRLLPDNALISVLKDISKSLKSLDEELVSDPDEKLVIELARKILNESLSSDGIEANRILKPEHENSAKSQIIVEAWSSGDTLVNDDLKGSVAAVWGKRIDGILNVTIAGECKNESSSDGKTVGKFIVIVSGKSPIKKGFDIQSQADVTFWIGEVGKIDVDASCLTKEKADSNSKEDAESIDSDEKASVKKKSLIVLNPILTDRKREFLALHTAYKTKLDNAAKRLKEEQEKAAEDNRLAKQKQFEEQKNLQFAKTDNRPPYQYLPDEVEIIEIEEEALPIEDNKEISVDSDYDHIQTPDQKIATNKKKVKRTRRIRRIPRRYFETGQKDSQNQLSFKGKKHFLDRSDSIETTDSEDQSPESDSKTEDKQTKTNTANDDTEKLSNEAVSSDEKLIQEEEEVKDSTSKEQNNNKVSAIKTNREEKDEPGDPDEKDSTEISKDSQKSPTLDSDEIVAQTKDNIQNKKIQEESEEESKIEKLPEGSSKLVVNSNNIKLRALPIAEEELAKKIELNKEQTDNSNKINKEVMNTTSSKSKEETELAKKLASITKIAPIKPQQTSSSITPAVNPRQKWESPAQSIIMRQPSIGAKLVYPERALAGKFLTVSVIDQYGKPEPSVELSFNGATLSTDDNGQAMFMVPEDATPGRTLHVSLAARPELNPGVIEVLQPLFTTTETEAPTIDRASKIVPDTKALVIDGHDFLGKANKNKVLIDSRHQAKVIAASPVQLQLKLPKTLACGKHKANVANKAKTSTQVEFEYIKASVVEGKKAKPKKTGDVIIKVQGTQSPVSVRLTNKTPKIVKINDGNELTITTSGGTDNSSKIDIKRIKKGGFRIDANIEI